MKSKQTNMPRTSLGPQSLNMCRPFRVSQPRLRAPAGPAASPVRRVWGPVVLSALPPSPPLVPLSLDEEVGPKVYSSPQSLDSRAGRRAIASEVLEAGCLGLVAFSCGPFRSGAGGEACRTSRSEPDSPFSSRVILQEHRRHHLHPVSTCQRPAGSRGGSGRLPCRDRDLKRGPPGAQRTLGGCLDERGRVVGERGMVPVSGSPGEFRGQTPSGEVTPGALCPGSVGPLLCPWAGGWSPCSARKGDLT